MPSQYLPEQPGRIAVRQQRCLESEAVEEGGVLWQRYTGRTFLTLIGTLVATAGFNVLAVKMGMHENARPLQLSIGLSFLGESLMVGHRGMTSGIPFAPARTR